MKFKSVNWMLIAISVVQIAFLVNFNKRIVGLTLLSIPIMFALGVAFGKFGTIIIRIFKNQNEQFGNLFSFVAVIMCYAMIAYYIAAIQVGLFSGIALHSDASNYHFSPHPAFLFLGIARGLLGKPILFKKL